MSDVKWTDKGLYHHPQPAGFVSLKQYMIIESDKKKCLLLRFLNELPLLVSAMEFKLTQLDSSGNVLDSTNVRVDSMSTPQNCTFALRTGIVLHKDCMDFTVTVLWAFSDGYRYVLRHGAPMPIYDISHETQKSRKPRHASRSSTSKIVNKGRALATLLSFGVILITAILIIYFSTRNFGNFTSQNLENLLL